MVSVYRVVNGKYNPNVKYWIHTYDLKAGKYIWLGYDNINDARKRGLTDFLKKWYYSGEEEEYGEEIYAKPVEKDRYYIGIVYADHHYPYPTYDHWPQFKGNEHAYDINKDGSLGKKHY